MKNLFLLIGPPAIGKSFWVKKYAPDALIINRDDIVESQSNAVGVSYNDSFIFPPENSIMGELVPGFEKFGRVVPSTLKWRTFDFEVNQNIHNKANEELLNKMAQASSLDSDVVVDMTNLKKEDRKVSLNIFDNDFNKIAVLFKFDSPELIQAIKANSKKRSEQLKKIGKEKTISDATYDIMINSYEAPSKDEGFDEIINYDNSDYLLGLTEARDIIKKILKEYFVFSN